MKRSDGGCLCSSFLLEMVFYFEVSVFIFKVYLIFYIFMIYLYIDLKVSFIIYVIIN